MHGEGKRKKMVTQRGKEGDVGGLVAIAKEEGATCSNYQNAPLLLFIFLVPNCSILDTASPIRNPNSKPKIDNATQNRLLVPKNIEARFNNHRTTSRVDNLIVFSFLIDLVLVNNC